MNFLKNKALIIIVIILSIIIAAFVVNSKRDIPKQSKIKATNVNVKKYSLDITGDTNTSSQFQNMVDSYPTGSTINIPTGKYKFLDTIKLKDGIKLVAEDDVIFSGNGKNKLISVGNSNSFKGIEFQNCDTALDVNHKSGLVVDNCKFTNNIVFAAINMSQATDSSVTNSIFFDIRKYGILIDNDSSNIKIHKNNFSNPEVFAGFEKEQISGHVYSLNGTKISVTDNILNNSGGQGVIFGYNSSTGKGTTDSVASNNHAEGNGQEGATIYGGEDKVTSRNSLIGNTAKNNRFNQIEIWESDDNIVKNNTVEESLSGIGNLGAITLFDTKGTTVDSNKVVSAQTNGIEITAGSYKCTITNNIIQDTNGKKDKNTVQTGNGILLDSNGKAQPQYITIKNNKITSSKGTIAKSGIYSTANVSQHNKIDGNTITGYKNGVHEYAKMTIGE